MTRQIEVGVNKKFDDVNRNNVNRGDVNQRITVLAKIIAQDTTMRFKLKGDAYNIGML